MLKILEGLLVAIIFTIVLEFLCLLGITGCSIGVFVAPLAAILATIDSFKDDDGDD